MEKYFVPVGRREICGHFAFSHANPASGAPTKLSSSSKFAGLALGQATSRSPVSGCRNGAGSAMIRRSSAVHACKTSRFSFTSRSSAWT